MTTDIAAAQIRGARALLGWSILELAKGANVSVARVARAENSRVSLAVSELDPIRQALEAEGIEFLSDGGRGCGLRLRPHRIRGTTT